MDPRRQRILVVEDDEGLLEIYRDFLEDSGYEVQLARNGEEALACLDARPDLVVLDLRMPVMDGHEFLRRLRSDERARDVPVLTVTARPEDAGGSDLVLRKPFDLRQLIEEIERRTGRPASSAP